jgi:hypothetical protein
MSTMPFGIRPNPQGNATPGEKANQGRIQTRFVLVNSQVKSMPEIQVLIRGVPPDAIREAINQLIGKGCNKTEIMKQLRVGEAYVTTVFNEKDQPFMNLRSPVRCPECGHRVNRVSTDDMKTCVICAMKGESCSS